MTQHRTAMLESLSRHTAPMNRKPLRFSQEAAEPDLAYWQAPLTLSEIRALYGPPQTLGQSEESRLAMDARLEESGVYGLLQHMAACGMSTAPQFVGYPVLATLSQNGLMRAGLETIADEMTKKWIELTRVHADQSGASGSGAASSGLQHNGVAFPASCPGIASSRSYSRRSDVASRAGRAGETYPADKEGGPGGETQGTQFLGVPPRKSSLSASPASDLVITALEKAMQRFGLQKLFNEASEMTGYFGGCLAYIDMGPLTDAELRTPLRLDSAVFRPGSLRGFTLVEPVNAAPGAYNAADPLRRDYFKPATWMIMGREIHRSRFLYFVDNEPPVILRPAYNFFGIPMAQIALDYVSHFTESRAAAARLLTKFSLTVLKTNMASILQGGGTGDLDSRIAYFANKRHNDGILAIDREEEDIVKLETPLSGVTDIVKQSLELLAAIFRIPIIKFLGVTPGGLNATGESDLKNHCDNIAAQQEKQLRPPLEYALNVLQMNEFGRVDESVGFHFVPLAQEDDNARAQLGKLKADTAAVYLNAKVLTPKEVRAALAEDASGGYHGIDPEALPEPEQGAAGQGGMGKEGMPGRAPQGTESLEFPSAANTQTPGASHAEGGPSLLNRKMGAVPAPHQGAVAGNDSAITGDEEQNTLKGKEGRWITTRNKQRVFIDNEGNIVAGMGGKFDGEKIDTVGGSEKTTLLTQLSGKETSGHVKSEKTVKPTAQKAPAKANLGVQPYGGSKSPDGKKSLDQPWSAAFNDKYDDQALAHADEIRSIMESETLSEADKQRAIQKKIGALSAQERFQVMGSLSYRYAEKKYNNEVAATTDLLGTSKEYLSILLTLQGVPQSAQEKAARYRERFANVGKKKDPKKVLALYREYVGSLGVDDLPEDMRQSTQELLDYGKTFVQKNAKVLRKYAGLWKNADSEMRKKLLGELCAQLAPGFGMPGCEIEFVSGNNAPEIASAPVEEMTRGKWVIRINEELLLPDGKLKELDFTDIFASVAHEMTHQRQYHFLRHDRFKDINKGITRYYALPSNMAINAAGYIDPNTSMPDYILQPVELQAHLLQRELTKALTEELEKTE